MKEVLLNKEIIKEEDITEEEIRVKALMINSKDEILLGYSYNSYQFPGGHLEYGETIKEALKREIKEETGINIELDIIEPFMMIKYFDKKYSINKCNKLYYFVVETDLEPNLKETNYTESEIKGNYKLRYVKLEDLEEEIIDNANKHSESKSIAYEMMQVISEFKNKK